MESENEEEIALLLAKHFDLPDPKHFDFSKIGTENKEELMKVLRKRRSCAHESPKQTVVKRLAPNGKVPTRPARPAVLNKKRRSRYQPALPSDSHTIDTDILTLGSVVPGCDPRVEPPGLVLSKARWHILRLEHALRKALLEKNAPTKLKKFSLGRIVN